MQGPLQFLSSPKLNYLILSGLYKYIKVRAWKSLERPATFNIPDKEEPLAYSGLIILKLESVDSQSLECYKTLFKIGA